MSVKLNIIPPEKPTKEIVITDDVRGSFRIFIDSDGDLCITDDDDDDYEALYISKANMKKVIPYLSELMK